MLLLLGAMLLKVASAPSPPVIMPDADLGPPVSHGDSVFTTPLVTEIARERTKSVRAGAILVEQEAEVETSRLVTDRSIATGSPFEVRLPAGSAFSTLRAGAEDRHCLERIPMVPFRPAEDENGDIFPGICLVDADGDGRFEALQFRPYRPDRVAVREVSIQPVRLLAAEDSGDPRLPHFIAVRRIRIAEVTDDSAIFALEHAAGTSGRAGEIRDSANPDRIVVPLRAGAVGNLGGITLRIAGTHGNWTASAEGSFAPWASLEDNGTTFVAGPWRLRDN
jgi:hypothetical protein